MSDESWFSYSNQNATRSLPISTELERAMSFLPDLGVTMDVYSGGQPAGGLDRVGSDRHNHGNSADVRFLQDGRMLDWNNQGDLPILSNIVSQARSRGVTGIGAGNDYMGPGRLHIGFGTPSVWGAGGKSANAPDWLRSAYYTAKPASLALAGINAATAPKPPTILQSMAAAASAPIMRAAGQIVAAAKPLATMDGRTAVVNALGAQMFKGPTASQPVGMALGAAPNGGIMIQGNNGVMNSLTQASDAWKKATGQEDRYTNTGNGSKVSQSGGTYYDRHLS